MGTSRALGFGFLPAPPSAMDASCLQWPRSPSLRSHFVEPRTNVAGLCSERASTLLLNTGSLETCGVQVWGGGGAGQPGAAPAQPGAAPGATRHSQEGGGVRGAGPVWEQVLEQAAPDQVTGTSVSWDTLSSFGLCCGPSGGRACSGRWGLELKLEEISAFQRTAGRK